MPLVPKKNIQSHLADVRKKPADDSATDPAFLPASKKLSVVTQPTEYVFRPAVQWSWKKIVLTALAAILLAYTARLITFNQTTHTTLSVLTQEMKEVQTAARALHTEILTQSFQKTHTLIQSLNQQAERLGIPFLAQALSYFLPNTPVLPHALKSLETFSNTAAKITSDLDTLRVRGFELAFNQQNTELIPLLERLNTNVRILDALHSEIKNQSTQLRLLSAQVAAVGEILDSHYLTLATHLVQARNLLQGFLTLLRSPEPTYVAILFQNPSEMRPAGGFLGSFGYIKLHQGHIEEIKIDDIYNADRQLTVKVIPPQELQPLTRDWGARDANWFPGFPMSAEKTLYFLEHSKLFTDVNIHFQGAIAFNPSVLASLMTVTGPIYLEKYGRTLDQNNFLDAIQYEVEAGQDKQPGQNPKKILSVLAPILMEKLQTLAAEQKNTLLGKFREHLDQKDLMLYFRDADLQNTFGALGFTGHLRELPTPFLGDYLMVVNANLAGGKTDAVIDQTIHLETQLQENGTLKNTLTITRSHHGDQKSDWWYRMTNKNYLTVLAPLRSELLHVTGNDPLPPRPAYTYLASLYTTDPDVQRIEATQRSIEEIRIGTSFGKTSFGARMDTKISKTNTVEFTYQRTLGAIPENNFTYTFIFEKQSGDRSGLEYSITAPRGFIWKESGMPDYSTQISNPKKEEIIPLTLILE